MTTKLCFQPATYRLSKDGPNYKGIAVHTGNPHSIAFIIPFDATSKVDIIDDVYDYFIDDGEELSFYDNY